MKNKIIIASIFTSMIMTLFAGLSLSQTNTVSGNDFVIVVGSSANINDYNTAQSISDYLVNFGYTVNITKDINYNSTNSDNVIAIGGSCVNRITADWLNVSYPTCGTDFVNASDVYSGQYLYQTFNINDKVGVILAGYDVNDTIAAAKYFRSIDLTNLNPDILFIGNSTTSSSSVIITTPSTSSQAGETYTVNIASQMFTPQNQVISVGDTVIWTNNDNISHTITSDTGSELSSSLLSKGQTYSHTFNTAGTYNYHCSIHPFMTGTIVVQ